MSNGDDSEDTEDVEPADPATFDADIDEAATAVENAETEADLDDAEALLDDVESRLEDAVFEVELGDEGDEAEDDEENPRDDFEDRLSDLRDNIEEQRGPYIDEVTDSIESAASTITSSDWATEGEDEVVEAVDAYTGTVEDVLFDSYAVDGDGPDAAAETLETIGADIEDSGFHPDSDEEAIQELLDGADALESDLDDATLFTDLKVREQLRREGFYDVLESENRKDFPPEWTAIKIYEKRGEVEPILSALDKLDSDFMQDNVLDTLEHIAPEAAFDDVQSLAQRREPQAVRILGRIGDESACGALHNFLGGGDTNLETTTLRALGMIGSDESTEPVAEALANESPEVRSAAARALGLIGDTRAVAPLTETLATDEANEVRASAAWALTQIRTARALETAAEYTDDRSYLVQVEAERAASLLDTPKATPS